MTVKNRYSVQDGRTCIDLKLHSINQLFDSLDPSPFLERDLDHNAVDYIVSATMEHSMRTPILIRVSLFEEGPDITGSLVADAIHNYFRYAVELTRKKNKHIFRQGQVTLVIASVVLSVCLTTAQWIDSMNVNAFLAKAIREGLIILGWVAMWRPIDVFLYSWWPQVEMRQVFAKLSEVPVKVIQNTG